jgi:hypothetical protein
LRNVARKLDAAASSFDSREHLRRGCLAIPPLREAQRSQCIVPDVKYNSLDEPAQPGDYLPYAQNERLLNDFEIRYLGDSTAMVAAIRQAIHDVDFTLPISDVTTLDEQVARSVSNQRLMAQLSSFFGVLAVFLSCIGIYGLMSYVVSRRTNEIGCAWPWALNPCTFFGW